MRSSSLAMHFLLLLVLLVAVNLLIARLAENSFPLKVLRAAHAIEKNGGVTDLFVGNSLMQAAFNAQTFDAAWPGHRSFNLGIGDTKAVEHYLLLKNAGNERATIYYGFYDIQLSLEAERGWDNLIGNRALAYYLDPDTAVPLYFPDGGPKAWRMRLMRWLPMLVHRQALWSKVERWRIAAAGFGARKEEINQFGRVEAFVQMANDAQRSFQDGLANYALRPVFSEPVSHMVELAAQRKVDFYFVLMPVTGEHRSIQYQTPAWRAYRARIEKTLQLRGNHFIDASAWVPDTDFNDPLHLTADGAKTFSIMMANYLRVEGRKAPFFSIAP